MRKHTCLLAAILVTFAVATAAIGTTRAQIGTVRVGVLHSLTGTMAISETRAKDAVLLAIEEINARGGVLGRRVDPVVVDPASDWSLFAEKAKRLVIQDEVAAVFGCWTSVSRKSVLPVFESSNSLLFYPVQYEGEEQSPNIFYLGPAPNQQAIPAAEYLMSTVGGSRRKFYLLGTDYVFPRTVNRILKSFLVSKGVRESDIVEEYTPFGHSNFQQIVFKIRDFGRNGDTAVISTLNGDSNVPFYVEFANQGVRASAIPIMALSVAEDELSKMGTPSMVGHLAAWNYFQSIDSPQNRAFVDAFKGRYGFERVTDDPMEAAYSGVYAWKAAVEKAGSFEVARVRAALSGLVFDAPAGVKRMDRENHHTAKLFYIGKIRADGQFDVVYRSADLIEPESFSPYLRQPSSRSAGPPITAVSPAVRTGPAGPRPSSPLSSAERQAVAGLRIINTAEITYLSSTGGSFGDIRSLIGGGLLDRRFLETVDGYNYAIAVVGEVDFIATALPATPSAGRYGFFSTPDGVVRFFTAPQGGSGEPVD